MLACQHRGMTEFSMTTQRRSPQLLPAHSRAHPQTRMHGLLQLQVMHGVMKPHLPKGRRRKARAGLSTVAFRRCQHRMAVSLQPHTSPLIGAVSLPLSSRPRTRGRVLLLSTVCSPVHGPVLLHHDSRPIKNGSPRVHCTQSPKPVCPTTAYHVYYPQYQKHAVIRLKPGLSVVRPLTHRCGPQLV